MSTKIAVILSGCGVQDGAEIHEAVCTLLALKQAGAEAVCAAPNIDFEVVNHLTGKATGETRNVLTEAARIARGSIKDLAQLKAGDVNGAILPGGFGAAKNLCDFAASGSDCRVEAETSRFLRDLHAAGKPIAALCIAPVVLARLFGPDLHPELTIGADEGTARAIGAMGGRHVKVDATSVVIDPKNRIVTTPCYMLAGGIDEVMVGAGKAVTALLSLV